MPFDMTPDVNERLRTNVIARLELLQELAAQAKGNQGRWHTCLWSEVRRNSTLRKAAGREELAGCMVNGPKSSLAAAHWFGFHDASIWSPLPLSCKRALIAKRLAELKATRLKQVSVG